MSPSRSVIGFERQKVPDVVGSVHGFGGDIKTIRFLIVFVGYSTLFWVPGTIFGARDSRYTVSGATTKLVVFAFPGRFRGL